MIVSKLLSSMILLAIWLIMVGLTQLGVSYPRWLSIVMGVIGILTGLLIILGM